MTDCVADGINKVNQIVQQIIEWMALHMWDWSRLLKKSNRGLVKWHDNCETGVNDVSGIGFTVLNEGTTDVGLVVTEALASLDIPVVLEMLGEFFVIYVLRLGYEKLLSVLGNDLKSFLESLDFLHFVHLKSTFTEMSAPSFRCSELDDGSLLLHYYSNRKGLEPIVVGIVKSIAKKFFDIEVTVVVYSEQETPPLGRETHTTFIIRSVGDFAISTKRKTKTIASPVRKFVVGGDIPRPFSTWDLRNFFQAPDRLWMDEESFCRAFPFHFVFDESLVFKQCGVMIQRVCQNLTLNENTVSDFLEIMHPNIPMTSQDIRQFINIEFVMAIKKERVKEYYTDKSRLILRGQMMWMEDLLCLVFLCTPFVHTLEEMKQCGLHFADLAVHDLTRDLVLANQQRLLELQLAKQLEQKEEELRLTLKQLEEEKKKTDMLLYSMMPRQAAEQLREGKKVDAGYFDKVTVLFSDIVKFTNICSHCKPIEVIHLLNDMYSRFDRLTSVYEVYKVETIGDAYMVVGGLHVSKSAHAQGVANFALGIIKASIQVKSPADGNSIKIRVGIHSGPVVTGVVGEKVPRYSLFGDTVNVASRMESHGVPGRIHISHETKLCLEGGDYVIEIRGEIEVKGKGRMVTYFLNSNKVDAEPPTGDDRIIPPGEDQISATSSVNTLSDSFAYLKLPPSTMGSEDSLSRDSAGGAVTGMKRVASGRLHEPNNTNDDLYADNNVQCPLNTGDYSNEQQEMIASRVTSLTRAMDGNMRSTGNNEMFVIPASYLSEHNSSYSQHSKTCNIL
ncbi:guanylate cyclase soluble subunit beta-2-like [Saccoglossus kowalevskii]|uniref:guanylate cyclase n=1 Tax=Saccoglossus kowalevskii TaxID=10224 RepID=A0ABM0GTI7_SACKO|nr:PREDICTED: guanylate cyclase soluble subunit beta-2-like [Saccoglossus kowalevskii]